MKKALGVYSSVAQQVAADSNREIKWTWELG